MIKDAEINPPAGRAGSALTHPLNNGIFDPHATA